MIGSLLLLAGLYASLWHQKMAEKVRIRSGDQIFATYSLNQERRIDVPGPRGHTHIVIQQQQVRIAASPCHNQYCVRQGWLRHAGQVAVCLPNQVTLELIGTKVYDSLNY